jgi:hypothetical protein
MYEKRRLIDHSHDISRRLFLIGSETDDIDTAYHILSRIREDRGDLKRNVHKNITIR